MRILTAIGEASAQIGERLYVFKPTLANIADIGTPVEIVEAFGCLFSGPVKALHPLHQNLINKQHYWAQLCTAASVLYACCEDDVGELIGSMHPPYRYAPGLMDASAIMALARQMLRHGVVGVIPEEKRQRGKGDDDQYKAEFDAAEMAALAQAHLNMSTAEAWSMTMTSLVGALSVKFPPQATDSRGAPPNPAAAIERNDAAISWLKQVNKLRDGVAANE